MNRIPASFRTRVRQIAPSLVSGGLLLMGLLAWGGCTVEDPIAYILPPDSGTGPLSNGEDWPQDAWAPPGEGSLADGLPDCAGDSPDAGAPCEDAGAMAP